MEYIYIHTNIATKFKETKFRNGKRKRQTFTHSPRTSNRRKKKNPI